MYSFKTRSLKVHRQLKTIFSFINYFYIKTSDFNYLKVNSKSSIKRANGTIYDPPESLLIKKKQKKKQKKTQILLRGLSKDLCQKSNQWTLWPGHMNQRHCWWEEEVTRQGHSNTALPRELCGLRNMQTQSPQSHQAPSRLHTHQWCRVRMGRADRNRARLAGQALVDSGLPGSAHELHVCIHSWVRTFLSCCWHRISEADIKHKD